MFQDEEFNDIQSPDYGQLIGDITNDEKELPYSSYYLLSDMPVEVFDKFRHAWPNIKEEKREVISRNMADLTESNYQVDFSPFGTIFFADRLEKVRLAALDMLWDSDNLNLVRPIIRLMQKDKSMEVRASAAATLGHYVLLAQWGEISDYIEGPIIEALLEVLDNPLSDPLLRKAALESISSSGHERVPGLIKEAYDKGDEVTQISAVYAMGQTADPRWSYILKEELDNPDSEMRAEASRAIGNIGDSALTDKVAELARYDDDLGVRLGAIFALGQIGNDLATRTLGEMAEDEEESEEIEDAIEDALEALMLVGLDIEMPLVDLTEDDDDDFFDEID